MSIHKLDGKVYFAQKAFIKKGGKVLVLKDPASMVPGQSGLDFPGGKYRWEETLEEGLRREVKEETGLGIEIGKPFFVWTSHNLKLTIQTKPVVYLGFLCKYKSGQLKLSDEHVGYEWVDSKTFKKWKDKTDDYKALETYFKFAGA